MTNEVWDLVKKYYKESFNLDSRLVDLMASYDVALLCASGASNRTISKFLTGYGLGEVTDEDVSREVNEVLGFTGWTEDMSFNPYLEYINEMDKDDFRNYVYDKHGVIGEPKISIMYDICVKCALLEDKLREEWK